MPKPIQDMSGWNTTDHASLRSPEDEYWQNHRAQTAINTQIMGDEGDYLGVTARAIGRQVGPNQHELFVSCDPSDAMQQQFEHLRPEFIAVHDIGSTSSSRLLGGLSAATGQPLQKLVIRRQGYGMALATLTFIELSTPNPQGASLRLYTTEADADTRQRQALANVLLAYSRLGVLMVGDLPAHALAAGLQPLRDALRVGPWPNRQLLVLPLGSTAALASQTSQLIGPPGLKVTTTPQVKRPAEAWAFIQGSWDRLQQQAAATGPGAPPATVLKQPPAEMPETRAPSYAGGFASTDVMPHFAATQPAPLGSPLPLRPMPEVPPPRFAPTTQAGMLQAALHGEALLNEYVQHCLAIKGMVGCCVFDVELQRPLAYAGTRPAPAVLALQGAMLHAAMVAAGHALDLWADAIDAAVSLDVNLHLLLRALPGQDGLVLHAVINTGNLAMARLQLERLDTLLE